MPLSSEQAHSTAPTTRSSPGKTGLIVLLVLFAGLWFGTLSYRHLVKPDEGRYAEIPREMVVTGDWVTPHLNGVKYFEKPALQYWATATAYELFGQHEWTARLWSALTGFAGVLLAWFTMRRLFGAEAGFNTAMVLATLPLYLLIGHINTLDMGVTFFMEATLCGLMLAQREGATARESRNWMLFTWAAMALAVLSKGLMGIVLPGAVLVLYTLATRDWRLWTRLHLGKGLLLFFAIAAPWFILVCQRNPDFFHFFFIREHFQRFLTKEAHRYQPWYYFIPILAIGILPWFVTVLEALPRALRAAPMANGFRPQWLLFIWAAFIYAFFSLSDSKLPSYILPIFPALAMLAGWRLTQLKPRTVFWQILPLMILAFASEVFLGLWPSLVNDPSRVTHYGPTFTHYMEWIKYACIGWGAFTLITLMDLWRRKPVAKSLIQYALGALIWVQLPLLGHELFSQFLSSWQIAAQARPQIVADVPFYSVEMYDQTLPFYLKHTFIMVGFRDELDFGLTHDPQRYVPDRTAFMRLWQSESRAYAVMTPEVYDQLKKAGLPMRVIARDLERVIVSRS